MAFKKHFKVLLPAAMLLAQILGSVFTSLLSFATTSLASALARHGRQGDHTVLTVTNRGLYSATHQPKI